MTIPSFAVDRSAYLWAVCLYHDLFLVLCHLEFAQ
jgi:hypothetical protein